MAEDHARKDKVGRAPSAKIFTAFKVALDPKKLLLAGLGILATSLGWWFLSVIFYSLSSVPTPEDYLLDKTKEEREAAYQNFRIRRGQWNFLHQLAGPRKHVPEDLGDIATSAEEYAQTKAVVDAIKDKSDVERDKELAKVDSRVRVVVQHYLDLRARPKPSAEFRAFPWFEYRGLNQFLVVSKFIEDAGKEKVTSVKTGETRATILVLFEPLVKFLMPIVYYFDARAGWWTRLYLVCVILWTVLVWGFFGGAITRMAAVQVARNEKVGFTESLRFARSRLQSYFSAPVLPLIFLAILTVVLWVFGLFVLIPILGELIAGVFWPVALLLGLIMAVVLVGLVGWPLMNATISAEGSDSFDALSRSYSYVYQAPWHYVWYSFLALVYGAVLVFFVGFMGSLVVYLGKWGVTQANYIQSRDPAFLFVHAPTSFGWRNLLLHDSPHVDPERSQDPLAHVSLQKGFVDDLTWYNKIGIYLVTFWLALFFLVIVGFSYSYFWTASTIIYLLMRHKVDDTDLDEIYLEEDERDQPFMPERPATPAPTAGSSPPGVTFTMVDAPQMRASTPAASTPASPQVPVVDPTPSSPGDATPPPAGNSPPEGS